jgi:hypothetical protein
MRRVYAIWFFRKITSAIFVETFIFAGMLFVAFSFISFFNVMKNAFNSSSSVYSLSNFFLNAFVNAKIISQMLFLGLIAVALILGWELLFKKRDSQSLTSPLL